MARIVRHDRARAVDDLHQLPDDAIGAERRGVRGQARPPLLHEARRAPPRPRLRRGRAARSRRLADRREQLPQHEPGVADAAERDVVAGREVAAIVRDLAERRLRRHRRDVERAREARADAEHEIGLREEAVDRGRPRAPRRAERERVVLGERALAVERRRDGRARELGEAQRARRSRPRRARPGRPRSRAARPPSSAFAVCATSSACACVSRGSAVGMFQSASPGLAVQHVVGDRDEHRAVARAAQRVERAPEHLGAARGVVERSPRSA